MLSVLLGCTAGCLRSPTRLSGAEFMMDTLVEIELAGPEQVALKAALNGAFNIMRDIADQADRYKDDSEIALVNKNAGVAPVKVSPALFAAVDFSQKQTRPEFDITLGPVIDLWREYGRQAQTPPPVEITAALARTGRNKVILNEENMTIYLKEQGMSLDLGGIAKGWAVETAARFLAGQPGVVSALVNGGGEIKVIGQKPDKSAWRIAIQDPRTSSDNLGVLRLEPGESVATSGDYHRYFEVAGRRYHHIINPTDGWPGQENISVTVLTDTAYAAEYYSKVFFLLESSEALRLNETLPGVEVIVVDNSGTVHVSAGLKGRFVKNEQSARLYRFR